VIRSGNRLGVAIAVGVVAGDVAVAILVVQVYVSRRLGKIDIDNSTINLVENVCKRQNAAFDVRRVILGRALRNEFRTDDGTDVTRISVRVDYVGARTNRSQGNPGGWRRLLPAVVPFV
jgi:hypothetical protein